MKKLILLLGIALLFSACSSDDGGNSNPDESTENYFPIAEGNEWRYGATHYTADTAKITSAITFEGVSYRNLINQRPIFGFAGNSMVRKEGANYYMAGDFDLGQLPTISIVNELIMKDNATNGELINEQNYTVDLDAIPVEQPGISVTVTPQVNLRITVKQLESYDSTTLNGSTVYQDVKKIQWTYYLSTILVFDNNTIITIGDHELIPEEQIGTLDQYFVNNIGLARSVFDLDYSNLTFNTQVSTPLGPIDMSSYLEEVMDYFESANYHNVSELIDYELN